MKDGHVYDVYQSLAQNNSQGYDVCTEVSALLG